MDIKDKGLNGEYDPSEETNNIRQYKLQLQLIDLRQDTARTLLIAMLSGLLVVVLIPFVTLGFFIPQIIIGSIFFGSIAILFSLKKRRTAIIQSIKF